MKIESRAEHQFFALVISWRWAICVAAIFFTAPAVMAAETAKAEAKPPLPLNVAAPESAALTTTDAAAFFDGMIPSMLTVNDIAGATISVVKDGQVVFARGYGYADVAARKPVVADRTLFRIASISKLFNWTAVMQQVEAGKIDLDRDINDYLDFKVPIKFSKPITMRHLMTHTAGFEERNFDLIRFDDANLVSLEVEVKRRIPEQIFEPGTMPAYSNYGTALAGYIVERVTKQKFEDYVQQRIFNPLGMTRSTFLQPVPANFVADISQGYIVASKLPQPFEFVNTSNTGGLSITAIDITQFMIAHLENGIVPSLGEASRILSPQTLAQMHAKSSTATAGADAMALGIYEVHRNARRLISHGGNLFNFHSALWLVPDARSGLFISWNSQGKNNVAARILNNAVLDAFMDRYFPNSRQSELPALATHAAHSAALVGSYETSRRTGHGLFAFFESLEPPTVSINNKGLVEVSSRTNLAGNPRAFHEVAPWQWQEVGGQARFGVNRADNGSILAMVGGPASAMQPAPIYRDMKWLQPLLIGAVLVLLVWLARGCWRAICRYLLRDKSLASQPALNGQRYTRIGAAIAALFVALVTVIIVVGVGDPAWALAAERMPLLRAIQIVAILAVVGALAATYGAVCAWRTPGRTGGSAGGGAGGSANRAVIGKCLVAVACLTIAYCIIVFDIWSPNLNF